VVGVSGWKLRVEGIVRIGKDENGKLNKDEKVERWLLK